MDTTSDVWDRSAQGPADPAQGEGTSSELMVLQARICWLENHGVTRDTARKPQRWPLPQTRRKAEGDPRAQSWPCYTPACQGAQGPTFAME